MSSSRSKSSILDKPLSKGKGEVSLAFYALLFSEIVQYCQNRSHSIHELQTKLSDIGHDVGTRLLDLYFVRERNSKREIKLLNMLLFVKSTLWKINKFISVPKDKGSLNCATFNAGIIEAVLTKSGFPAKVTAHWHKGTTYMVKFEDSVIARDKSLDDR
ncbi:hypothetical protein SFRURICE_016854 [Spodoptera frugiperda]|nr:hypothetical protein SFRURICE_016854 [Spodoptera frugiperda]